MTYRFYTRGTTLWVRVNLGVRGQKIERSTGITFTGYTFDPHRQRVTGRDIRATRINRQISDFESKLLENIERGDFALPEVSAKNSNTKAITKARGDREKYSITTLDAMLIYLQNMESPSANRRVATLKNVRYAYNIYAAFTEEEQPLDLITCDLGSYTDRRERAAAKNRYIDHLNNYISFLGDSDKSASTIRSIVALLIAALNRTAERESLILPSTSELRLPKSELEVNALRPEHVKLILEQTPSELTPNERVAFDAARVILLTTLRISDISALTAGSIAEGGDGYFIKTFNKKTGALTTAPVTPEIATIVKSGSLAKLKPLSSNVGASLSAAMKRFPQFHEEVTRHRYMDDGTVEKDVRPLYQFITPHMLRRSAITTMLINGVPEVYVRQLSGHPLSSAAFGRYVALSNSYMNTQVRDYQAKLLGVS